MKTLDMHYMAYILQTLHIIILKYKMVFPYRPVNMNTRQFQMRTKTKKHIFPSLHVFPYELTIVVSNVLLLRLLS
jgi:hypothetical protein